MTYNIVKDVTSSITVEQFRSFLRTNELPVSGNKPELVNRIISAVNGTYEHGSLNIDVLDEFIAKELANGKQRLLFISSFPETAIELMTDVEHVTKCLKTNGYPTQNFNNLRDISLPAEATLSYLNIHKYGNKVTDISMCFVKTTTITGIFDEEGIELPPKNETEYIWVEILSKEARIIIKTSAKGQMTFGTHHEAKELHEEIETMIRTMFSLAPSSISHIKHVLYDMFKDLTETAEKPYRNKVAPYKKEIEDFSKDLAHKIGLKNIADPVNLPHRLTRLLERALIQQDFEGYERYFEGKRGVVNRIYYSDATGATVNARSSEREEGIAVADIYFDTKESIESRKILDKIWVSWFYKNEQSGNVKKIETKFEVHKNYFILHFLYGYSIKEIQDHVLSNLRHYEGLED
ncbi:SAP domain-containing protein [Bacillus thuringiensis]|uniref:SAP domain-containing protein n=1 Tax=Bacillus thuringiensis TaxID=1428 RepID=UPI001298A533|nr:SAP domain-containing protein [Bacillus thuringiensis]MEB8929885.1 SAP domain-containing protein [Bacillus cereus]MCR6786162.1 SAP domain-containing protein [Bacillus thuringiensis]MCR6826414.1 SAP domain-containing protein [Bacillus thuringiensis]MCR6832291.1 SAP domain-containing protein [Bacillus thuringiensis]MEB9324061.1 SAP domain-containing protein [Bacillus cereus]